MKHIKIVAASCLKDSAQHGGCGECQASCQTACKVANQPCERGTKVRVPQSK